MYGTRSVPRQTCFQKNKIKVQHVVFFLSLIFVMAGSLCVCVSFVVSMCLCGCFNQNLRRCGKHRKKTALKMNTTSFFHEALSPRRNVS